jgi:hypothetical protein
VLHNHYNYFQCHWAVWFLLPHSSWRWLPCWNKLYTIVVHLTVVCHIYFNLCLYLPQPKICWNFKLQ